MKKVLVLLVAVCMLFTTACSKGNQTDTTNLTEEPSASTNTVTGQPSQSETPTEAAEPNQSGEPTVAAEPSEGEEPAVSTEPSQSQESEVSAEPQPTEVSAERKYLGNIDVTGMPDATLKNKTVTIFCWGEYVPEKVYDWQGYRFSDYYGGEVKTIVSSGGDYYEDLYKLIASGDIPDVVVGEAKSFPMFIMRDIAQPWDDYIHYDDPVWELTGAKDTIEELRWNGKIYNLTGNAHSLAVMFYNKRIVSESGLEDPAELYKRGEWDWNAFKEYLEACTYDEDGDGVIDVHGMSLSYDFLTSAFASTGEEHIEFNGETFINNMKSKKIRDAADFLYSIGTNGAGYMSLKNFTVDFIRGKSAFVYTNDYRGYVDFSKMWKRDGLGIVPFPKYPEADENYQAALADNWWLMKGAKNPEGAGLLMLAERYDSLLNVDPNASSVRESAIQGWLDKGYTEEAAEACVDIANMPKKVLYSRAIFFPDGAIESRALDYPWTTLADSAFGEVDKAIKDAITPLAR